MQAPHKRLLLAAAPLAFCGLSFAQQNFYSTLLTSNVPHRSPFEHWNWTKEEWTADSRPFTLIRRSIDNALTKEAKPAALALRYKAEAQKKPRDPQAQFRWAYAAYREFMAVYAVRYPTGEDSLRLYRAGVALDVFPAPSPRSYEYTRLRFLVQVVQFPARELTQVGRRLIRHNPQDDEVMYRFLSVLAQIVSTDDERAEYLAIAQKLVQRDPKIAKYHAGLGGAYKTMWQQTKSKADAAKAIAGYRKYLELAPPNALFRKRAQWWIDYIQKNQK